MAGKWVTRTLLFATAVFAAPAYSTPVTIGDTVWVDPWSAPCSASSCDAGGSYKDYLGTYYNTTKIVIDRSASNGVTTGTLISLYTDRAAFSKLGGTSGSSQTRYDTIPYADLAIAKRTNDNDTGGATTAHSDPILGPFNDFDFGIELNRSTNGIVQGYSAGTYQSVGSGNVNIYQDIGAGTENEMWRTSQMAYGETGSGTYGGRYRNAACGPTDGVCLANAAANGTEFKPIVDVDTTKAIDVGDAYVTYRDNITDSYTNPYHGYSSGSFQSQVETTDTRIDIFITDATLAALGLLNSDWEIFWGTAWCSNDAIWGFVDGPDEPETHEVPEPATLALLGFGALGLALHRRRRAA